MRLLREPGTRQSGEREREMERGRKGGREGRREGGQGGREGRKEGRKEGGGWESGRDRPVVANDAVNSLGDEFEQEIEVHFLWLLAIGVKAALQLNNVDMSQLFHDLCACVCVRVRLRYTSSGSRHRCKKHFLSSTMLICHDLPAWPRESCSVCVCV